MAGRPSRTVSIGAALCLAGLLTACDSTQLSSTDDISDFDIDVMEDIEQSSGPIDLGENYDDSTVTIENDVESRKRKPERSTLGSWSKAREWPLSPIHMTLLSNGSVLTYGTDALGENATGFTVDVWNPSIGLRKRSSHTTLPTGIDTNLFCSAQAVLPDSTVLLSGGDEKQFTDDPRKNNGVNDTTLFDPATNTLTNETPMSIARWYPTLVSMADGKQMAIGGRAVKKEKDDPTIVDVYTEAPELFDPATKKWTVLNGATNPEFYKDTWFYPRAFLRDDGNVVMLNPKSGGVYQISATGNGSLKQIGTFPQKYGFRNSPAVMFEPGKILFLMPDSLGSAAILDLTDGKVRHRTTGSTGLKRLWANATLLANGEVFLNGGNAQGGKNDAEKLAKSHYKGQIWNPETGKWTDVAKAKKPRRYHSTAILLPDATVLTAGGGPPGPVINMNAEIFSPPYLYNSDGRKAKRPEISQLASQPEYGNNFTVSLANSTKISKISLVRAGSNTHAFDMGQRFMSLEFTQSGSMLDIESPESGNVAPPGLYMLFVLDDNGVPSKAELFML